jgi:hypothetical protein
VGAPDARETVKRFVMGQAIMLASSIRFSSSMRLVFPQGTIKERAMCQRVV